jgi:signal transduction histidine kinase
LCFEDNGTGIPEGAQDKIFDMFQRLHGPEYPGTGIGLALVRKVVEQMGGRVGFESVKGNGSRFWLALPQPSSIAKLQLAA